jgi:hypothetical protein
MNNERERAIRRPFPDTGNAAADTPVPDDDLFDPERV